MFTTLVTAFLTGGGLSILTGFLEFLDKKNSREHELAMADKGIERTEVEAIAEASKEAGKMDDYKTTGYRPLDALMGVVALLSATVRPVVTYFYVIGFYGAYKIALFMSMGEMYWTDRVVSLFSVTVAFIITTIIGFWFVSREIRKRRA
jgi:hypothetical protein